MDNLAQNLSSAHQQFVTVANQLEVSARTKPGVCGEWSPQDVIAHLNGWDYSLLTFIVDLDNFVPPTDVDLFNQQSVEANKGAGWDELMAKLSGDLSLLVIALTEVDPTMKIYPRVTQWVKGRIADYQLHHGQLAN